MTREEAIDLLDNLIGMVEDNHKSDYDMALQMAIQALEQNESAEEWYKLFVKKLEQEACGDTISREAVNDLIEYYNSDALGTVFIDYSHGEKFKKAIDNLPSVTPEEPINHELFRKALKHRLYERYMDNPAEFKALCELINDVESVVKHNTEVWARMESEERNETDN